MQVAIDPRIELISVVQHLAGSTEYLFFRDTPYRRAAQDHFSRFRSHPAVTASAELHDGGIGHDAPIALAVYLDRIRLAPIVAADHVALDARWRGIDVAAYLSQLQDFALESRLVTFLHHHVAYTSAVETRLAAIFAQHDVQGWFEHFLGPLRAELAIVPKLLAGTWSYDVHARYPSGRTSAYMVIELEDVDEAGLPRPTEKTLAWVVHEIAHEYVNPLVERSFEQYATEATALFEIVRHVMEGQAYTSPVAMVEETLVRALVVLYLHTKVSEQIASDTMHAERARGFVWISQVVEALVPVALRVGATQYPARLGEVIPALGRIFNDCTPTRP